MAIYLITWNLNNETIPYDVKRRSIISALRSYDLAYDGSELDTVAFVNVPHTISAVDVYNSIITILNKDDRLVVTRIHPGDHFLYVSDKMREWLLARM